jgi:hypothetical protein
MFGLNPQQQKLKKQVSSAFKFRLYVLFNLPMGWLAGMKIIDLTENHCITSVPFKWINKNPFKSVYFAVQSMAAELSTATACMVAIQGHQPSIALIIVDMKGQFYKKATGKVFFTCLHQGQTYDTVAQALASKKAQTLSLKTVGKMSDGTLVSEFVFTWSFKQRQS